MSLEIKRLVAKKQTSMKTTMRKRLLDVLAVSLPPAAAASALWIMGEWIASLSKTQILVRKMDDMTSQAKVRLELKRVIAKKRTSMKTMMRKRL